MSISAPVSNSSSVNSAIRPVALPAGAATLDPGFVYVRAVRPHPEGLQRQRAAVSGAGRPGAQAFERLHPYNHSHSLAAPLHDDGAARAGNFVEHPPEPVLHF